MELAWLFVTAFVISISGALAPGPMLTYTVGESVTRGWNAGPLIVLGHALLEIALIISLFLGLNKVLTNDMVKGTIGFVGGGVLLWMGANILLQLFRKGFNLDLGGEGIKIGFWKNPILGGAVVSLSNPYFLIWWATIGFTYLVYSVEYGLLGICLFVAGHLLADLLWYTAISVFVAKGKSYIKPGVYQGVLAACGVFMVVIGLVFIGDSWRA